MSRQEIIDVLGTAARQRFGQVEGVEFGVDEGPFEDSSFKYVAYHIGCYQGDFYFNTADEFLNGFLIGNIPIGQLLDQIAYFKVGLCNN